MAGQVMLFLVLVVTGTTTRPFLLERRVGLGLLLQCRRGGRQGDRASGGVGAGGGGEGRDGGIGGAGRTATSGVDRIGGHGGHGGGSRDGCRGCVRTSASLCFSRASFGDSMRFTAANLRVFFALPMVRAWRREARRRWRVYGGEDRDSRRRPRGGGGGGNDGAERAMQGRWDAWVHAGVVY